MATKYFALLTNIGAAKLANATALGVPLNITQMSVGDGGGTLPTPSAAQMALVNELRRAPLNSLSVDPNNANQIIAEQVIPEDVGGWWIREIGLFDEDGNLIAVGNCAETYKPQLQEGSGRTQVVRMIFIVNSTSAITLKIDPSVVLATREYVDNAIIVHEQKENPHPQYLQTANALSEIVNSGLVSQVLANLGLGNARFVIDRGANANGIWRVWSDGVIEASGWYTSVTGGLAVVLFPIAMPSSTYMIAIAEHLITDTNPSENSVHVSMILDDTMSEQGFSARCQNFDGSISDNGFSWAAVYSPI